MTHAVLPRRSRLISVTIRLVLVLRTIRWVQTESCVGLAVLLSISRHQRRRIVVAVH